MGYDVYYSGEIKITPALKAEDRAVLQAMIDRTPNREMAPEAASIVEEIENEFSPYYAFPMDLCDDNETLEALDEEEREGMCDWLRGFIKYFFQPRGYSLEGSVTYSGDSSGDHGEIYVKSNEVESVEDVEVNEGPSWAPKPFVSHLVCELIQSVVDSADSTGCDGDLTVCSKSAVETLAALVQHKTSDAVTPAQSESPKTNPQPSELSEKYDEPGKWGQHPTYTMTLWQTEILNSQTRRGYWDWVSCKLEVESAEGRPLTSLLCSTSPVGE